MGLDGKLHPNRAGAASAKAIKPYVTMHLVGKDGRRLGGDAFAFESQLPRVQLTVDEDAPVWDEEFNIDLSGVVRGAADSLALTLMDQGTRGWFGNKSDDVELAQARVEWTELTNTNLRSREAELPLFSEQVHAGSYQVAAR